MKIAKSISRTNDVIEILSPKSMRQSFRCHHSDLVLVRPIIRRLNISSLCLLILVAFGIFFENKIPSVFENGGVDNPESDESSPELNESSPELSDFSFSGVVNPEFPMKGFQICVSQSNRFNFFNQSEQSV